MKIRPLLLKRVKGYFVKKIIARDEKICQAIIKHPDTPIVVKMVLDFALYYPKLPISLIPNFIPIIGLLDDLLIVPLLIKFGKTMTPKEIMDELKKGC